MMSRDRCSFFAYNLSGKHFNPKSGGVIWNQRSKIRRSNKSNTDISDFSFSSADAKAILKNHILLTQKMGNSCEWNKYRDKLVLF